MTIDSSVRILQACQWLCGVASKDADRCATPTKESEVERLEELKLQLDTINSRLHVRLIFKFIFVQDLFLKEGQIDIVKGIGHLW